MIAILQFDAASPTHLEKFLEPGHLPNFAALRSRGIWYQLETPATTSKATQHARCTPGLASATMDFTIHGYGRRPSSVSDLRIRQIVWIALRLGLLVKIPRAERAPLLAD